MIGLLSRSGASRPWLLIGTLGLLTGCVAYEPRPQDPHALLSELDARSLSDLRGGLPGGPSAPAGSKGLGYREAAALAVSFNPALSAARGSIGIARSELVEAGLLPDPEIGFDGMDALSTHLVGETPTTVDYLGGVGLTWEAPRPGEIPAREAVAGSRLARIRAEFRLAEWRLARDVVRAWLDIRAGEERQALNRELLAISRRTTLFFSRAREARAVTALQEVLAATETAHLEEEQIRIESDVLAARQRLNELLGLPPGAEIAIDHQDDILEQSATAETGEALVETAIEQRPEIEIAAARYEEAESALRLAIAGQWPRLTIGTSLALVIPIFSRFNRPAIRTALAVRAQRASELRASIHAVRADVAGRRLKWERRQAEVVFHEEHVAPTLDRSLSLAEEAFRTRELTLLEILTAQRQVLAARERYLEERLARAEAWVELAMATGTMALVSGSPGTGDEGAGEDP